jgi:hypothetical protein
MKASSTRNRFQIQHFSIWQRICLFLRVARWSAAKRQQT